MPLDSHQLIPMYDYIDGLPQGFESYPDCQAKAENLISARKQILEWGHSRELETLPGPIQDYLHGRHGEYVPEVVGASVLHLHRAFFPSEAAFFKTYDEQLMQLFSKPSYRLLMKVLSPALAVLGAAKRWGAFHRGSTFTPGKISKDAGRSSVDLTLAYPPEVFDDFLLRIWSSSFKVALDMSGGTDVTFTIRKEAPGRTVFAGSWA